VHPAGGSAFLLLPHFMFVQHICWICNDIVGRNTQRPRSKVLAQSKATSYSSRPVKENPDGEEEEDILSARNEEEYTETSRPTSKTTSRPLVSFNNLSRVRR